MMDIHALLQQLADQEAKAMSTEFMAPCLKGGSIRTRVQSLVLSFRPQPDDFEGWGIFRPVSLTQALLVEVADDIQIMEYLGYLTPMRWFLASLVQSSTWLAYPINESEAQHRWGQVQPSLIHLVSEGNRFEQIVARWDGCHWWFEALDRRADPLIAETLREQFKAFIHPETLKFKGLTPEMRTTYTLACQHHQALREQLQHQRDQQRLQQALQMGGGELQTFRDRDDFWQLEWRTLDGSLHTSAISKADLTVIGAGICLSGQDRDFDLQSLVGVIEQSERD